METLYYSRERIRVVQQDISKWDKNGDGKLLTGGEREEFRKVKRKEAADAEASARAAKAAAKPPKVLRLRPTLSADEAQTPLVRAVPKNVEDATK